MATEETDAGDFTSAQKIEYVLTSGILIATNSWGSIKKSLEYRLYRKINSTSNSILIVHI